MKEIRSNDEVKAQLGRIATFTWMGSGAIIILAHSGLGSLLSLRSLMFLGVGMFIAAFIVGLVSYKIFLTLADKAALAAGADGAREAVLRSFRQSQIAGVALCLFLVTWAYSSFFLQ